MSALNLLFPRKCFLCGEMIGSAKAPFCDFCFAKYEMLKRQLCRGCGRYACECACVPDALAELKNIRHRHLFRFESEQSKKIIYAFKRRNVKVIREFIADECAGMLCEELRGVRDDIIISYPPRSVKGVREYGFDQARLLAKGIAKRTGIKCVPLYSRKPFGKEQKKLSRDERAENADKLFFIKKNISLAGKTLVIADDVLTSGSTVKKLASLAAESGARAIIAVTVARA